MKFSTLNNTFFSKWTNSLGFLLFSCWFFVFLLISSSTGLESDSPSSFWTSPTSSERPHGLIYPGDSSGVAVDYTTTNKDPNGQSEIDYSTFQPKTPQERILAATSILGYYEDSHGDLSNWMARISDSAQISSLSIPGTHDSATWNYTQATQAALNPITGVLPPAIAFQCQSRSLFQMLGDGVRFFDLRVGYLPGLKELGFFHAAALLDPKAALKDVLLGFYLWLDDHPTETLLVSIKVDNATFEDPSSDKQPSTAELQKSIYQLLRGDDVARSYWFNKDSELGNMGESRGKIIFIQRVEWNLIRSDPTLEPIGIPIPPSVYPDNNPSFSITYNNETNSKVFIEDFYDIKPNPSPLEDKVDRKFKAIKDNIDKAIKDLYNKDQLFITFASGEAVRNNPPITPKATQGVEGKTDGVNKKILDFLNQKLECKDKSNSQELKRLGILVLDWYYQTPTLIKKIIDYNFQQ
ncbi:PLC-like phosphodiesterase [Phakopsora pachyrhizi]|uniref:PLC-like phosphodiesterase n=1 Tax=Phakopsora pachyrhizi TaxID=170000 RepID=A0AAV0B8Q1_PHAPC|nr:PLC-like phosphodiesterase [Phakopsora pachyrhizi]CAH7682899.1 PLC-like phosphodiesterase [Phakopsora pachyrhizi]